MAQAHVSLATILLDRSNLMNRIVIEHYPASKLPKDMRGTFDKSASVKVVVEEEKPTKRLTYEQLTALIDKAQKGKRPVTTEEAVARVRELRDEWDD